MNIYKLSKFSIDARGFHHESYSKYYARLGSALDAGLSDAAAEPSQATAWKEKEGFWCIDSSLYSWEVESVEIQD